MGRWESATDRIGRRGVPGRAARALLVLSLLVPSAYAVAPVAPGAAQSGALADPAFILDNGVPRTGGLLPEGIDPADEFDPNSQDRVRFPGTSNATNIPGLLDTTAQRLHRSIGSDGRLSAPSYADIDGDGALRWTEVVANQEALDIVIGVGRDAGSSTWHQNVELKGSDASIGLDLRTPNLDCTGRSAGPSGAVAPVNHLGCVFPWDTPGTMTSSVVSPGPNRGVGSITYSGARVTIAGAELEVTKVYTLEEGDPFIRIRTTIQNRSSAPAENVRFWVGSQDDFINGDGVTVKSRGNLRATGFEPLSDTNDPSRTLLVMSADSGVVFFTTYPSADAVFDAFGPNFPDTEPSASGSKISACTSASAVDCDGLATDGSYILTIGLGDLVAGEAITFDYYYSAGALDALNAALTRLFAKAFAPTVSWDIEELAEGGSATITYGSVSDGFVCDFLDGVVLSCRSVEAGPVGPTSWAQLQSTIGSGVYTVRAYGGVCNAPVGTSECDPTQWKNFDDPFGDEAILVIAQPRYAIAIPGSTP